MISEIDRFEPMVQVTRTCSCLVEACNADLPGLSPREASIDKAPN